jgi:hypothetical protein
MSNYVVSLIRTNVPYIVSAIVTFLATKGIDMGDDTKTALITFLTWLLGSIYYAAVRYLEKKNPQMGKLLGVASKPTYK